MREAIYETLEELSVGVCNIDQPQYTRAMPPTAMLRPVMAARPRPNRNSVRPSMYTALLDGGLIERGEASRRFYVTELGHHELVQVR